VQLPAFCYRPIWGCKQLFLGRNAAFCRQMAQMVLSFLKLKDGQKSNLFSAKLFIKAKTLGKASYAKHYVEINA
jgi:hypothetical protein